MAINTYESAITELDPPETESGYLALVDQLLALDPSDVIEARDALAHEMARNPNIYLPRQFEDLSLLYRDRTDRERWDWSEATEEVAIFVSRTPDRAHIEEQYVQVDTFSYLNQSWQTTTYAVKVLRERDCADLITCDGTTTIVRRSDAGTDAWTRVSADDAYLILVDFFYESLRATAMQLARSPEERSVADRDAQQKIEMKLYGGPKARASTE